MRQVLIIIFIIFLMFSFLISDNTLEAGFYNDNNKAQYIYDSLSVQDSIKIYHNRIDFYNSNYDSILNFKGVYPNNRILINVPSSSDILYILNENSTYGNLYFKNDWGYLNFMGIYGYNITAAFMGPSSSNDLTIRSSAGNIILLPGNSGNNNGDLIIKCDDNNYIFYQDSSETNQAKIILDGNDIGWYWKKGFPLYFSIDNHDPNMYMTGTDSTIYFAKQSEFNEGFLLTPLELSSSITLSIEDCGAIVWDGTDIDTLSLPTCVSNSGLWYNIINNDSANNDLIIKGNGSENINGSNTKTLANQYDKCLIRSTGNEWLIFAE